MIISNKNQLLATQGKKELVFRNYHMQFSYSSPRRQHRKAHTLSAAEQYHPQTQPLAKSVESSKDTRRGNDPSNPWSLTISSKPKPKAKRVFPDDSTTFITQDFPQRKIKTNEHQLFKYLSKLQDNQLQRFKTEHLEIKTHKASKGSEDYKLFKPHLKLKMSPSWVKHRYCANRDRDNGMLPSCFGPQQRECSNRFGGVGVRNLWHRN